MADLEEYEDFLFLEFIDHYINSNLKVIYALEVNFKVYIGQTNNTKKRFSAHKRPKSKCRYIRDAIQKYGIENVVIRILERDLSIDDANMMEAFYIELLQTLAPNGYNLTIGGDCLNFSEETLKIFRSPEMRQRRRELSIQMWNTQEHRDKIKIIVNNEEYIKRQSDFQRQIWKIDAYRVNQMNIRTSDDFKARQSEGTKKQWQDPKMRQDKIVGIIKSRPQIVKQNIIKRGATMRNFIDAYTKHNGIRKMVLSELGISITHYKRLRKAMECMYFI
ncbi:GIY-YIG catalytic domain-containing endonuclease [Paramecium bursaria Chlorella virus NE-JV-4]|nr:GIY-YIG catalytic domain-containing endonuclease [Paramecium bursaria Chlorella virus NE-JV-4]